MSPSFPVRSLLVLTVAVAVSSCGAEHRVAPAPVRQAELAECRSFEALMPRFVNALSTGQTESLREVLVGEVLSGSSSQPPAVMRLLQSLLSTLGSFARAPPEEGAEAGQVCAVPAPAVEEAHPLCELRRGMESLVHEGRGLDALALVDPLLSAIFNYVVGRPPSSSVSHYEIAGVLYGMCGQNAVCQLSDTLDLLIAVLEFTGTPEGRAALDNTQDFLANPALQPFLTNDAQQYGGEEGVVALTKLVLDIVQAMDDPADLDALPVDTFPLALRADVRRAISDLKLVLDPHREPNVLRPLKKVSTCYTTSDRSMDGVRMFYRLWFEAQLPDFSFLNVVTVLVGLRDTDERGTLLHLARTLALAVREDEAGMDAAAEVCRLLSTRANAERAMPVVASLFEQGVVGEAICAVDTLVYGCAGGAQPACELQRQ